MSKPKEKKNVKEVIRKKDIIERDPIPPFNAIENAKIGIVTSKNRT